jgi:hypothetical protein
MWVFEGQNGVKRGKTWDRLDGHRGLNNRQQNVMCQSGVARDIQCQPPLTTCSTTHTLPPTHKLHSLGPPPHMSQPGVKRGETWDGGGGLNNQQQQLGERQDVTCQSGAARDIQCGGGHWVAHKCVLIGRPTMPDDFLSVFTIFLMLSPMLHLSCRWLNLQTNKPN